jgi:protein TonB
MFEDFAISPGQHSTQQRFRRSFMIAFAVYGTAGAALVSASNTARTLIKENLVQVAFTPPPEVKPEPPPPVEAPKPKSARAGVSQRKALKPPDTVPDKKPPESNAPLAQPTNEGPQDGVLGVVGGTGKDSVNAQPPPEPVVPAKELPGNQQPPYPKRAERDGVEGEVLVAFDVLEDGRVANPKIVKGPAEFHEVVLQIALTWRYRPATLAGKPVKHRATKRVLFRLED